LRICKRLNGLKEYSREMGIVSDLYYLLKFKELWRVSNARPVELL